MSAPLGLVCDCACVSVRMHAWLYMGVYISLEASMSIQRHGIIKFQKNNVMSVFILLLG